MPIRYDSINEIYYLESTIYKQVVNPDGTVMTATNEFATAEQKQQEEMGVNYTNFVNKVNTDVKRYNELLPRFQSLSREEMIEFNRIDSSLGNNNNTLRNPVTIPDVIQ